MLIALNVSFVYFTCKSPFNHLSQDKDLIRVVVKKKYYFCFLLNHKPTGHSFSQIRACREG